MENQRVRITKKMLKDSLIVFLARESIHKITVREICEEAQVNRSTFYKYYGSPYDLLEEIENDVIVQINSYLTEDAVARDGKEMLIKILAFINENIDMSRVLLNNNIDPRFPERLIQLPTMRQIITRQLPDKYNEEDIEYIMDFAVNGGFSTIKKWINKDKRESPEKIAELLNITIIKMLPV
jgi:AcrR family transcriptional regulator